MGKVVIKRKAIEKATKGLAELLKPILIIKTEGEEEKYEEAGVTVYLWDLRYGGVRIAELSLRFSNGGGVAYMRADFLYDKPNGLHKLFMLCEEWIVLTALGDEMGDLPGLTKAIQAWPYEAAPPEPKSFPRCRICWKNDGVVTNGEFYAAQSTDQGKHRTWVPLCREHRDGWNEAGDWEAPVFKLVAD